jgi:CRP-like cAMP-binding protein
MTDSSATFPGAIASYDSRSKLRRAWSKYPNAWKRVEVPARHILLREGEIARKAFLIEKGCARVWFMHDGKEISFQFFFEADVVCSVESYTKSIPSPYSIETIEPSTVRWIRKHDMDLAIREDPFLRDYLAAWAVESQAAFIRHFFSFLKDNPYERYSSLVQEHPKIIQRVPLQYIASYLGISPVSLSRIRGRK